MSAPSLSFPLVPVSDVQDPQFDAVILVTDKIDNVPSSLDVVKKDLQAYKKVDSSCEDNTVLVVCPSLPGRKLIFSPTGPLNRDYDDVRRFQEAAVKGLKRAVQSGSKSPLVALLDERRFPQADLVTLLGVLHSLYVPLDIRQEVPEKAEKIQRLGIWTENQEHARHLVTLAQVLEEGRMVTRDIGGGDPERMAPLRLVDYMRKVLDGSGIKISVISDRDKLEKEFPLMAAVDRAAQSIERHRGHIVFLEYEGEGPIDMTLCLVGKGVTYDTGGADVKTGGGMLGMHRDKCGAAFVAGFFKVLSLYKPKGLRVFGGTPIVRNSVGSEAYVTDEIIVSRAGKRVRIGNTDAEGRMIMADVLCHMKERALGEKNVELFTIATLTGHVIRAFGPNYAGIMENGPAKAAGIARVIQKCGDDLADPFEISTIRREDYELHTGRTDSDDVHQSGSKPSTMENRGHQAPAAFLIMASGLDKHGIDSDHPLKYSHIDIAGSSGPYPGTPTASPLLAMSQAYVLNRPSTAAAI